MPGKFWTKLRFGYLGQVLTAGVLLTIASLLLFAVISTLQPTSPPQVAKTTPVSEAIPPVEAAVVTQHPASGSTTGVKDLTPESQLPAALVQTVGTAADHDTVYGNEAIQELWNGAKPLTFGWQLHPLYRDWRYHNGVDINGGEGQVVPALLNGEIVDVYTDKQYGLTVAVKSGKYTVYYGALASVAVQKNTMIKTGKPIGSMGISSAEPEPHLHLAVKSNDGRTIDPHEIFSNIPTNTH